jgi:Ca2+-transporting ATPase
MQQEPWHQQPVERVFSRLNTSASGLSTAEAAHRLEEYGPNEIGSMARASPLALLLAQFKNVLIVILLIATGLSAFLGHELEAIAIAVIVTFAVLLGFIQEYRAERAIEALREMAAPTATVLRDGQESEVPARELVPGDVVLLGAGAKVPADLRLVEAINLKIEESALTGESVAVEKQSAPLPEPELSIGDRRNMAYAGTAATYGRGRGAVVATGRATEFGTIAQMIETVQVGRTPLQDNLDRLGRTLAKASLVVVGIIVGLGLLRGQPFVEMLVFGVALAVAVVPEALPAVVTISLAIGVRRMVKRNALVRRLPAVETLGSTSVICSDKTGTLTKDEMTLRRLLCAGQVYSIEGAGYEPHGEFSLGGKKVEAPEPVRRLLRAAALASDAHIFYSESERRWHVKGDATEGALVVAAAKAGLNKPELDSRYPRVHEVPFTSETKRMTTLHQGDEGALACSKGAPEILLESCRHYVAADGERTLDDASREAIRQAARAMASEALRVLGVADKKGAAPGEAEEDMTFLGLVGMIDPPRPEAEAAIETCLRAGIRPVMITGDHPLTAQAVARELGMLRRGKVVTGAELSSMSDVALEKEAESVDVYARVSPAHKLKVVTALQNRNHVVAMTGDGVNDAPALKKADIGIAMGITGTDVTKEAAAITLLDDNFASIVAAVEEGRAIFGNIKKYLMYLLSSNIGEILLMAGATLLGIPLPLSAVQILYVNLATDGLPALALAVDPPEPDLMSRPPRSRKTGIFTRPVVALMLAGGLWSALANLGIFIWALRSGRSLEESMTMTFVSLVIIQFFKAYNFRSDRHSVLRNPFANRWLNVAILWELLLLGLILYVPFLAKPFGNFGLSGADWAVILAVALSISPVLELMKWLVRKELFGKLDS